MHITISYRTNEVNFSEEKTASKRCLKIAIWKESLNFPQAQLSCSARESPVLGTVGKPIDASFSAIQVKKESKKGKKNPKANVIDANHLTYFFIFMFLSVLVPDLLVLINFVKHILVWYYLKTLNLWSVLPSRYICLQLLTCIWKIFKLNMIPQGVIVW